MADLEKVKDDTSFEKPDAWWTWIPGVTLTMLLWQYVFPHHRMVIGLQWCHYYDFGEIPPGKHARMHFTSQGAFGVIEVFVLGPGQVPGPGVTPRYQAAGAGDLSVYGRGRIVMHQSQQTGAPNPTQVEVRFEDD